MTWTYQCYVTNEVPNLWVAWYERNPHAQGPHDARFDILEDQDAWGLPLVDKLKGKNLDGLLEVRFKANNVQWRIFGCYGQKRHEFIVLHVGNHKGKTYNPKNVMDTAAKRMKDVNSDASKAKECHRPGATPQDAAEGISRRLP